MDIIEKSISNLVESQFPEIYREEGPIFIAFVKKYYEWLEQNKNVLYHSRRLFEYKDIDETVDDFIIYFKEQYLKNIQLDTVQSTRTLVKHSLDLYRSKGTERSIELLFRVVFGADCKIYYPGDDLFRTSDGVYHIPKYIEASLNNENVKFAGKGIVGVKSKAIAFVDRVIRRNDNGKLSDIFFVSSIRGNFQVGEQLDLYNHEGEIKKRPVIIGSLNSLKISVAGKGENFSIGDVISLSSNNGFNGKAKVTEILSTTDKLSFSMESTGYGYSNQSVTLISEKNITIDNNSIVPDSLELVYQPLANIHYVNGNGDFQSNTNIFSYTNNVISGMGKVISTTISNSTSGYILVEILSGNLNSSAIYSTGNTVAANLNAISGYSDMTASGKVIGYSKGSSLKIGLANIVNQFYLSSYVYSNQTHLNGKVTNISLGAGGSVSVYPSFNNIETVDICVDKLKDYLDVELNATSYNLHGNASINISSSIAASLAHESRIVGSPKYLTNINPGHDYNDAPYVQEIDYDIVNYHRYNQTLLLSNTNQSFSVGETVTQANTDARGYILSANSSEIYIQNMRISNDKQFKENLLITGTLSGVTANVVSIITDYSSKAAGENCIIDPGLKVTKGAIVSAKVIDSGFNFSDDETVTFVKDDIQDTMISVLGAIGTGTGYYKRRGSEPSGQKKLRDSEYYQEFSYDIISPIMIDKYSELLKQTVHTAGFKFFGTFSKKSRINMINNKFTSKIQIIS